MLSRTLELSVFSAGKYSMGMGLPDLEGINDDVQTLDSFKCSFLFYPAPM